MSLDKKRAANGSWRALVFTDGERDAGRVRPRSDRFLARGLDYDESCKTGCWGTMPQLSAVNRSVIELNTNVRKKVRSSSHK